MNCYKVDFECMNYQKDSVYSKETDKYLTVEAGSLYLIAKDLKEVQEKLESFKSKIVSCIKVGISI